MPTPPKLLIHRHSGISSISLYGISLPGGLG